LKYTISVVQFYTGNKFRPSQDNTIHFLDIAISKTNDSLNFDIYRKPTSTDTIIPKHSCHPPENKAAAINFLTNLRDSYSLGDKDKEKEDNIIKQILRNNKYDTTDLHRLPQKTKTRTPTTITTKSAKFTYIWKETKYITLLKNTINNLLRTDIHPRDKYQMTGVYKLTFPDCNKAYIGQTGSSSP
jgi:hypothetical protein